MQIGLNLSLRALNASVQFNPASLFAAGEQGAWYDPSDFSTLFQDAAGTTPVTAVEQPVGLMLDKSKGLVLGSELVTNANTSTAWTTTGTNTVTQDGSAVRVTYVDSNAGALVFLTSGALSSNLTVGKWYKVTFEARVSSGGAVNIALANGATNWSYTLTTTYQTFTGYINYTVGTPYIGRVNDGSFGAGESYWVRNISVKELPGNHAFQSTGTSRTVLKQEANGAYYLLTDGVDDWYQTNSINFTGTDKMTVVAGVRKLSDAAVGMLVELSANLNSNNGTFYMAAPVSVAPNVEYRSKGTLAAAFTDSPFAAPISLVVTGASDIAADQLIIRTNGVEKSSAGDQGTGNYGNYPLFLFRRGGASLPYNGRFYGLIVRGAQSTAQQIAQAETWMNGKTRAY